MSEQIGEGSTIVLIADRTFRSETEVNLSSNKLEMISDEYFEEIHEGLSLEYQNVICYQTPSDFIDNIQKHKNDIVFTIYGGSESRNRMALVPSICEAYNITFVGADAYARLVCQDKILSKNIAASFGIQSPKAITYNDNLVLNEIYNLKLPLIIKPNFEGSSIGITENSKVLNYNDAIKLAMELSEQYKNSIIIEEFIEGIEVCVCLTGTGKHITLFKAMEVYDINEPQYLINHIYSAKSKHLTERIFAYRDISSKLTDHEKRNILNLYKGLGKMDYMRIDGRITTDGFKMIELTPDAYLGRDSAMFGAAKSLGWNYNNLLGSIIKGHLKGRIKNQKHSILSC